MFKALQNHFATKNAEPGPHQKVEFENKEISMDIPREGITVRNGWHLLPLTHPGVRYILAYQLHITFCTVPFSFLRSFEFLCKSSAKCKSRVTSCK